MTTEHRGPEPLAGVVSRALETEDEQELRVAQQGETHITLFDVGNPDAWATTENHVTLEDYQ